MTVPTHFLLLCLLALSARAAETVFDFTAPADRLAASAGAGTLEYYDPAASGWGPVQTAFGTAASFDIPAVPGGDKVVMAFPDCTPAQAFESVRHFHSMGREAGAVPEPVWPEGIALRAFDGSDEMLAVWLAAYNEGMASHFRFRPGVPDDCRELAAAPGFLPEDVQVAFAGRVPVGLVREDRLRENGDIAGLVEIVAVAPAHRGRGPGRALLRHGMRLLLAGGAMRIRLMVDADGAIAPALYQSEGFATVSIRRHWERAL